MNRCTKCVAVSPAKGLLISTVVPLSGPTDDANPRRPLSFHAVSFGQDSTTASLRRMAQIALEVQNNTPRDPLVPDAIDIPSSYTAALDTVSWPYSFHCTVTDFDCD